MPAEHQRDQCAETPADESGNVHLSRDRSHAGSEGGANLNDEPPREQTLLPFVFVSLIEHVGGDVSRPNELLVRFDRRLRRPRHRFEPLASEPLQTWACSARSQHRER